MMRFAAGGILSLFFTFGVFAELPTLADLQKEYGKQKTEVERKYEFKSEKRNEGYRKAIEKLMDSLQDAGQLDSVLIGKKELERLAAEQTVAVRDLVSGPAALVKLQETYLRSSGSSETAKKTELLEIERSYGRRLSDARKILTQARQLDEATKVDAEWKLVLARFERMKNETGAAAAPEPASKRQEIALSVMEPWPFQMRVRRGDRIHIKASGAWKVFPGGKWHNPGHGSFYLRGRYDENEPFKVGAEMMLEVPADATLSLGMNEGGSYDNNRGEIKVKIELTN